MAKKKPQAIRTVWDMRAIPESKIDHFCEDLRLWLHMHKQVERIRHELLAAGVDLKVTTPTEVFDWIDDGRHDANITVQLPQAWIDALESERTAAAVDPHATDQGTPTTRD